MTVWFITNCSSRFGRELVLVALNHSDAVIATSRNKSDITDLEEKGAKTVNLDLSSSDDDIQNAVREAIKPHNRVDILIHGPGELLVGMFEETSAHELRSLFDTNFFGQISVTQAIVPYMRQQMNGTIAFVGSVEGWVGCEAIAAYVASRWAIAGLAQSVRDELHRFDIKVTVVEPSDTPMQLFKAENMSFLQKNVEAYDGRMEEVRDCAIKCWEKSTGDVAHAAGLLAAALFGGGPFVGKELPARLVLGSKAVETVENTLEEQKTSLAEWKDISLRMESLTSQEESPESPEEEDSYFPKQV